MVEPPADAELARLLDEYGQTMYEWGSTSHTRAGMHGPLGMRQYATTDAARAVLLAHIAASYVRRVAFTDAEESRLQVLVNRHEGGKELTDAEAGEWRGLVDRWSDAQYARAVDRYRAARGILPWQPGDELPEVRIRRLRDAEEAPGPPIVAGPLSRVPVRIRLSDGAEDRTTWPLRAIVGDRRYGGDTSGRHNVLDCGHESSVLHGGTPERMPDGRYGKRCQRCAAVIDHNERYDYDVRD